MYTFIAQQFCNQVKVLGISERIKLYEYMRYGWTFHAKGLWYYLPNELLPSLVFVGSSNFGVQLLSIFLQFILCLSCFVNAVCEKCLYVDALLVPMFLLCSRIL